MSLLPLSTFFKVAIGAFHIPGGLRIIDTHYTKVGSSDQQVVEGERMIAAAVDKTGGKRLENIFGGSVADGDIGIWTEEELYIADQYAPGELQRQSFCSYAGVMYRVAGKDPWKDQTGQDVYLGKRHVVQEII